MVFNLRAAGSFDVEPGLHVTAPTLPDIDDTPIKMARGKYDVSNGKLTVDFAAGIFEFRMSAFDPFRTFTNNGWRA